MKKVVLFLVVVLVFGCNLDGSRDLLGTWKNNRLQFVFLDKSNAMWIVTGDESIDTFRVKYTYRTDSLPNQLDFYDFEEGTLKGLEMYGIIEFSENRDTFFYAGDTARSPEEGATKRPTDFERGAMKYIREQ